MKTLNKELCIMKRRWLVTVITLHTGLLVGNNYLHQKIDLLFGVTEFLPVLILFALLPLVGIGLLFGTTIRQGLVLLLGSLPAELFYHIYTRFSSLPPITRQDPALIWKILYEGSFGLILVCEVVAFWTALQFLKEVNMQSKPGANQSS
jgi:hypothetical protein